MHLPATIVFFTCTGVFSTTVFAKYRANPALCKVPIKSATGNCRNGNDLPSWLYGYNNITKKCVQYPTCFKRLAFESNEICLETCNKQSRCLQPPETGIFDIGWSTYYVYNSRKNMCKPVKKMKFRKTTSKQKNLFNSEEECQQECMPSTTPIYNVAQGTYPR
uniref:Haemaphysalin n=1 Tax=Haemaphysalis longicornis TaxID=44386 RepID=HAEM_HAELO